MQIPRNPGDNPVIPKLNMSDPNLVSSLQAHNTKLEKAFQSKMIPLQDGRNIYLQEAAHDDYPAVELIIQQAATRGHVIAMDEFLPNGMWNRKFLHQTHIIIALHESSSDPIGLALFGASKICRTETVLVSGYVITTPGYETSDLDRYLLDTIETEAKALGYEGVLLDVYQTDRTLVNVALQLGYHITGSLPHCGYVKDVGYTDSVLFYKEFSIGSCHL